MALPPNTAWRANVLFGNARTLSALKRFDEALACYEEVVALDPENEPAWFNAGLIHKGRRDWAKTLECNVRAGDLDPSEGNPAHWNAGIAATALSDWPAARRAWARYGIELEAGEGPPTGDGSLIPIRLNPESGGEVVWARRIDPARAQLESIPLPESGHRWGDIVLHDGEPRGERVANGRAYDVLDELARLVPSPYRTYVAEVRAPRPDDVEALEAVFGDARLAAEDWSRSIRRLCDACSRGQPHEHPGEGESERVDGAHSIGLAAKRRADVSRLLDAWASGRRGRAWTLAASRSSRAP